MRMHPLLLQFLLSIAIFTALDALWFTMIMNKFFIHRLSHLLNIQSGHVTLRWVPALLVYLLLACGVIFFVLPAGGYLSTYSPFIRGGIFGAIIYGFYEGMNGTLMKDWPIRLMFIDILWGAFACGITTAVVQFFVR